MSRINTFLELVVRQGGSDLHVISGLMPRVRIHGLLEPIRFRELTSEEIERILSEFMSEEQRIVIHTGEMALYQLPVGGITDIGDFCFNPYFIGPRFRFRYVYEFDFIRFHNSN